jgi:Copper type II ascorbate-dependent monooxygenase, N-terminal domain/Copper type II ascorbate-dependent monooxygenase, C-terminal domain
MVVFMNENAHRSSFSLLVLLLTLAPAGCGRAPDTGPNDPGSTDGGAPALTYHRDARAIIEARCTACHRDGDIAPFPLTTYEEVELMVGAMAGAIASGEMPPWQPADGCNSYGDDFSLRDQERETLLAWLGSGAPAGDPADYVPPELQADPFRPDITLQMPESYTPSADVHDDYRCFLLEWTETAPMYITGAQIQPDQRGMVHHVIIYEAEPDTVETVRAIDEAEAGPGYTCYGGPLTEAARDTRLGQIMAWVPGQPGASFPAGTGIRVEPGSLLIMQMHYNVDHAVPGPDQSRVSFSLAPEVERPAVLQLFTNPAWLRSGGMPIPADDSDVTHLADMDIDLFLSALGLADDIGLEPGGNVVVHNVGMHMHELGTRGRVTLRRQSGVEECMLDIPDWDFHWQGGYELAAPMTVGPGDHVLLQCWWDNSAANQPLGEDDMPREPQYTEWGEGTGDEMCITGLYLTAE